MSKKKKESFKKEPQLVDDASQIKAKRVKAVPEKKNVMTYSYVIECFGEITIYDP